MRFSLSQEQEAFRESLRRALAKRAPQDRVHAFTHGQDEVHDEVWSALCEVGAGALLIPEAFGGAGAGLLEAALVAEALGAAAAPSPFLGSGALAPLALLKGGSPDQRAAWLPGLAEGRLRAGVGISEAAAGARDGAGLSASGGRLSGGALFVLDADAADILILADPEGRLYLVEAASEAITLLPLRTLDRTRRLFEVRLLKAPFEPLRDGDSAFEDLRAAAYALLAADMLGAADASLAAALDWARSREQFARPIGSFQAVKHLCAEMAAELEPARALVWYAAYALCEGLADAPLAAAHAKAHLSEVGRFVARTATEVHGGAGFTERQGLHLFFKRIELDRQLLGGPERVRRHAAELQGLA